jgi:hypothetical protein
MVYDEWLWQQHLRNEHKVTCGGSWGVLLEKNSREKAETQSQGLKNYWIQRKARQAAKKQQ